MPTWWGLGKSSSKDVKKKPNRDNFFNTLHRFISNIETKGRKQGSRGRRHCNDTLSEMDPRSRAASRSPSPSNPVSRCQSFSYTMHAQPLPLPQMKTSTIPRAPSGMAMLSPSSDKYGKPSLGSRPPTSDHNQRRLDATYIDGDLTTASISSNCSTDTDDPVDSQLQITVGNDVADATKTVTVNPSSMFPKDRSSFISLKKSRGVKKPVNLPQSNHALSMSPKTLNIATSVKKSRHGAFASAPDSSLNSPCRSPKRLVFPEQISSSAFWAANPYPDTSLLGSGQCSSPGSGQTSGHNSMSGQLFWQTSRASPECSPIPSPRLTSPGPGSRIQSGAVTPLHPHAGGTAPGSPSGWLDDGKKQSHRLPLPPINIPSASPFSTSNKILTNMSIPRSPGKSDNPTSPGSRWKKGKLIGRGTFGHVYVGFNSENGEMCAMKEVTLFDDAKSRESAKQLGQEVSLLSRLQHHNIVQYYGSEMIDDRLYIYLEYVSGGSIHKLLQEYGQFGELAIRSFTYQILSGLAYLHAKNTVHRDIKGANILVDPNGRVKLADFGMAKHITGQSGPLSFKGSPYWMAPEVIKNTNGCNLSVDIWSLGCTVLEMATSKPPWSQYEGIAAMFKIGNSKELPFIPNSLSSDGKDFIRKCLRRDPSNRPTATELLKHPFVRNAAPLERAPLCADQLESTGDLNMADKGSRNARNFSSLDMESLAIQKLKAVKVISAYSDFRMRNASCPVSPIRSPLLQPRSPKRTSGRVSPPPISSPTTSSSSTPRTCSYGFVSSKQLMQSYMHKGHGSKLKSSNFVQANGSDHFDSKCGHHHMKHDGSFAFRECQKSDSDTQSIPILRTTNRNTGGGDPYDFPAVVGSTPSQKKKDHIKMKTCRI